MSQFVLLIFLALVRVHSLLKSFIKSSPQINWDDFAGLSLRLRNLMKILKIIMQKYLLLTSPADALLPHLGA